MNIEIIRGRTENLKVYVNDANGEPYALASSEKLVFGAKKNVNDEELAIKKIVTEGTDGVYVFEFAPAETEELAIGKYYYDVAMSSGEDLYPIIKEHYMMVCDSIVKHGDVNG